MKTTSLYLGCANDELFAKVPVIYFDTLDIYEHYFGYEDIESEIYMKNVDKILEQKNMLPAYYFVNGVKCIEYYGVPKNINREEFCMMMKLKYL